MSTSPDSRGTHGALGQLKDELSELQGREQAALAHVVQAQDELDQIRRDVKRLVKVIELYGGESATKSLTKKKLDPLIREILAEKALNEKQVVSRLEATLKNESIPLTGLKLVLKSMRKDFVNQKGLWQITRPADIHESDSTTDKSTASPDSES